MIQGGDPTGTGKGGESIHGGANMRDEFHPELKHGKRDLHCPVSPTEAYNVLIQLLSSY